VILQGYSASTPLVFTLSTLCADRQHDMCGASIRWLEMVREGGIMLIIRHEKALIKGSSKSLSDY